MPRSVLDTIVMVDAVGLSINRFILRLSITVQPIKDPINIMAQVSLLKFDLPLKILFIPAIVLSSIKSLK